MCTILLIDDDPLVRWSLSQHLGGCGFTVRQAATAAEALALGRAGGAPQLMLLDLKLPDMGGLALLKALREGGLACPVIVLSAYVTPELTRQLLGSGVCCVVEKPFLIEDIGGCVRGVLATGQPPPNGSPVTP